MLNGVTKNATVFAPKRPAFGPAVTPELRDKEQVQERYGLPVQPMESFFTYFGFGAGNEDVKKLYLQLTPPDGLLHARMEARFFAAAQLDHPLFGQPQPYAEAIERIQRSQPRLPVADLSPMLDELRWVKTPFEIERLRKSGRVGAEAVAEAIRATTPGMFEYEIAAAAQYVNTRMGARGDGFPPIVPSGPLAPIAHYMDNRRQMQAGRAGVHGLRVGLGVLHLRHHSDVAGSGQVHRGAGEDVPLRAGGAKRDHRRDEAGDYDQRMKDAAEPVYARYGYRDAFLENGRYMGHFMGISVHDVGNISGDWAERPFVAGVVFNVEPILEFADKKIHIRLEDTMLITETGPRT